MTSTIPPTWGANQQLQNPIASPSSPIYLVEAVDDFGPQDERDSSDQSSACSFYYYTNWNAITSPSLSNILFKTIVGGYYNGDQKKHTPMQHPYRAGCFAKDIVSVTSVAIDAVNQSSALNPGAIQPYQVALLHVSYESRPYPVNSSASGLGYNPNWISFSGKGAYLRQQMPLNFYEFTNGTYANSAIYYGLYGTFLSVPSDYVTVTIHAVPASLLFASPTDAIPKHCVNQGKVNTSTIWGAQPGCLLFDSLDYEPFGDFVDNTTLYTVHLTFIYNGLPPKGGSGPANGSWQQSIDPTGVWQPVTSFIGSNPPYLDFDVAAMVNALNAVA